MYSLSRPRLPRLDELEEVVLAGSVRAGGHRRTATLGRRTEHGPCLQKPTLAPHRVRLLRRRDQLHGWSSAALRDCILDHR